LKATVAPEYTAVAPAYLLRYLKKVALLDPCLRSTSATGIDHWAT
jgi:hypothetical protein